MIHRVNAELKADGYVTVRVSPEKVELVAVT